MIWIFVHNEACNEGKWTCKDGRRCIKEEYVCDGFIHCQDGSDEKHEVCALWNCSTGNWKCSNNICIIEDNVCDGIHSKLNGSCGDGSDEADGLCSTWQCRENRWKCPTNKCILLDTVCNGQDDCTDGADENYSMCNQWNCTYGFWKCNDSRQCIETGLVCDGNTVFDCKDGSDEQDCGQYQCPAGGMKCPAFMNIKPKCITKYHVCDGITDCTDSRDELAQICGRRACPSGRIKCLDKIKICVPHESVLNGVNDCNGGSDENPQIRTQCHNDYHMCDDNEQRIKKIFQCDGRSYPASYGNIMYGCQDGSDEAKCEDFECFDDYWKCADNLQCIEARHVCDGKTAADNVANSDDLLYGCIDKSDEHNKLCGCPTSNDWPCHDGEGCIPKEKVCDGTFHCNDESDELISVCRELDMHVWIVEMQGFEMHSASAGL